MSDRLNNFNHKLFRQRDFHFVFKKSKEISFADCYSTADVPNFLTKYIGVKQTLSDYIKEGASYITHLGKSGFAELENFEHKLFLFKKSSKSQHELEKEIVFEYDEWEMCNVLKMSEGKALISTVDLSHISEYYVTRAGADQDIIKLIGEAKVGNKSEYKVVDIFDLKPLKYFIKHLVPFPQNNTVSEINIDLLKFKEIIRRYVNKISTDNHSNSSEEDFTLPLNFSNFHVICNDEINFVQYIVGDSEIISTILELVQLEKSLYLSLKEYEKEFNSKTKYYSTLKQISTYYSFVNYRIDLNFDEFNLKGVEDLERFVELVNMKISGLDQCYLVCFEKDVRIVIASNTLSNETLKLYNLVNTSLIPLKANLEKYKEICQKELNLLSMFVETKKGYLVLLYGEHDIVDHTKKLILILNSYIK